MPIRQIGTRWNALRAAIWVLSMDSMSSTE